MSLPSSLVKLLDEGIIDDVKGRLLSGKEASVFVVERRNEIIAAKVYKSREQRSFRATASYTEGRNQTRNSRDKRAMHKRSSYGRELLEESWRDMEFRALSDAFHAGVRVPEPILLYEDVLLMELLVDEAGEPAPRLADFDLTAEVAELLHREVYGQVRLLLQAGRIHGDLSAFNVLISDRGVTLIDLPQVIDAAANSQAAEILHRDLKNVTEHLARFAPELFRLKDCGEALWRHYQRGTLDSAMEPEPGRDPEGRNRERRSPRPGRGGAGAGTPYGNRVPMNPEDRFGDAAGATLWNPPGPSGGRPERERADRGRPERRRSDSSRDQRLDRGRQDRGRGAAAASPDDRGAPRQQRSDRGSAGGRTQPRTDDKTAEREHRASPRGPRTSDTGAADPRAVGSREPRREGARGKRSGGSRGRRGPEIVRVEQVPPRGSPPRGPGVDPP